jgi:hypothetical protein
LHEPVSGASDEIKTVLACVAGARIDAQAVELVGKFRVLLAALRANQQDAGASHRNQLPNVGYVRHDNRPSDGAEIFLLRIVLSLPDGGHQPLLRRGQSGQLSSLFGKMRRNKAGGGRLSLVAAKA